MTSIIIDTNAYSHLLKGNKAVQKVLEQTNLIYLSPIVIGELKTGFKLGSKTKFNQQLLDDFINQPTVQTLDIDSATSEVYSNIFVNLKKAGTPIPLNDVWIAAQALQTKSSLLTYDQHFSNIPSLKVISP